MAGLFWKTEAGGIGTSHGSLFGMSRPSPGLSVETEEGRMARIGNDRWVRHKIINLKEDNTFIRARPSRQYAVNTQQCWKTIKQMHHLVKVEANPWQKNSN